MPPNEYRTEEDPKLFHSIKTQRGPLSENWIEEYKRQVCPIMCAYKLCKVEFRYWGMQSKIERFIHDTGERLRPRLPATLCRSVLPSVLLPKADSKAHVQLPTWFVSTTCKHLSGPSRWQAVCASPGKPKTLPNTCS